MGTFLTGNPLAIFALLLVLSVVVPPLVRPLRLPDLVGLLVAGVVIGPHGLAWLVSSNETVRLLSDVGVIYLLFIAGLEIDLGEFQRIRARSFRFGLLTFTLPMLAGTVLGFAYGYPAVSAVLIGSILASHTPWAIRSCAASAPCGRSASRWRSAARSSPTSPPWWCWPSASAWGGAS